MDVLGVDRVLIATRDIDDAAASFGEKLGIDFGERIDPPDEGVANRMSTAGLEFVTADDGNSPVGRFLDEEGPGVYAVALRVADLDAVCEHLAGLGVDSIGETGMGDFRELFYHPADFDGVMVVLAEYDAPHPAETASLGDE